MSNQKVLKVAPEDFKALTADWTCEAALAAVIKNVKLLD